MYKVNFILTVVCLWSIPSHSRRWPPCTSRWCPRDSGSSLLVQSQCWCLHWCRWLWAHLHSKDDGIWLVGGEKEPSISLLQHKWKDNDRKRGNLKHSKRRLPGYHHHMHIYRTFNETRIQCVQVPRKIIIFYIYCLRPANVHVSYVNCVCILPPVSMTTVISDILNILRPFTCGLTDPSCVPGKVTRAPEMF